MANQKKNKDKITSTKTAAKTSFKADAAPPAAETKPARRPRNTNKTDAITPVRSKSNSTPVISLTPFDPGAEPNGAISAATKNSRKASTTIVSANRRPSHELKLEPPKHGASSARRTTTPASSKKAKAEKFLADDKLPSISPGIRQEIYGILLIAFGVVLLVGMFAQRGFVADAALFVRKILGLGGYLIPPLLIFIGATFIWEGMRRREQFNQVRMLGGIILIVSFTSIIHLLSQEPRGLAENGGGGGFLSYYLSGFLSGTLTSVGAFCVLLATFLVGVMITFNISWRQLWQQVRYQHPNSLPLGRSDDFDDFDDFDAAERYPLRVAARNPADDELLDNLLRRTPPQPQGQVIGDVIIPPSPPTTATAEGLPISGYKNPSVVEPVVIGVDKKLRPTPQNWQRDQPPAEMPHREWLLPKIDILATFSESDINEKDLTRKARLIEETLLSFGVEAKVKEVNVGPTVTRFALEPGFGVKVARITSLSNDLALALAAPSIRLEAPVPGLSRVGVEVPNAKVATVGMREIMEAEEFTHKGGKLKIAMGRDVGGLPIVSDLAKMPHLLIAGSTGSGKSVFLNSVIAAYLLQYRPDELKFIMVDPKMVELIGFNGIPHLQFPVVTQIEADPDQPRERGRNGERVPTVMSVLKWSIREMERRYKHLSLTGHRNIEAYNKAAGVGNDLEKLPYIVLIVDELADLMMVAPDEAESNICRLAQKARAVGIHLILATQRPSVDVVTGLIKANFPTRITFAVTSQMDSRVILDTVGAEKLLGRGDMLYLPSDAPKPMRVQGVYVSDEEIDTIVKFWRDQNNFLNGQKSDFAQSPLWEEELNEIEGNGDSTDELFETALEVVRETRTASVSLLQRRLRIGYNQAARLVRDLEEAGVIGHAEGSKPRPVLLEEEDFRDGHVTLTAAAQAFEPMPSVTAKPTPPAKTTIRVENDKPVLNAQARRNQERPGSSLPTNDSDEEFDEDPPL